MLGIGMGLDILPRMDWFVFGRPVPVADFHKPGFIVAEARELSALPTKSKALQLGESREGDGPWHKGQWFWETPIRSHEP